MVVNMNRLKKYSIAVLTVCLFLFSACPVFAQNSNEFLTDYWMNTNGYWIHPRKQIYNGSNFTEQNYFPIYGKKVGESSYNLGSCYFVMDNGKYRVSGDSSGTSLCSEWYGMTISLNISNIYKQLTVKYTSANKDRIINTLNGVGFVYEDNGTDTITYYVPNSYVYYRFDYKVDKYDGPSLYYSNTSDNVSIMDYDDNGNLYATNDRTVANKVNFYTGGGYYWSDTYYRAYGYQLYYQLSVDYNSIEPIFNPIINNILTDPKIGGKGGYASYLIRPNGDLIGTNVLPSYTYSSNYNTFRYNPIYYYDTKKYNRSGKYGLNASFIVGIIPPSNTSSNLHSLIENLKLKKYPVTDPEYLETMFTNSAVGDSFTNFYNNGLDSFIDFTANRETHLPVSYANYIYNQHTYWNNRNNYYWWSTINYNPDDGSGDIQQPDDSTPDNPSGGSGIGGGDSGGSGSGDINVDIDTTRIEELLQQIIELLQSQNGDSVDLSTIESLINDIKNNMKDYTGDITTIYNTLTLINQFLSNNIDVPLSDLKTILEDLKTLQNVQNEQLTGISGVLQEMKTLFLDIYQRLGEIKDKIGSTINNIEEGTNLWDVLKALIDNLGEFLSSGLELFEKLLVPQGTFETDFNSTITSIQDKLGVLYQPVEVFSGFLTDLYAPTEVASLSESSHIISIPEVKYQDVTIIEPQELNLDETVEQSGLKPLYEVYLLIVDMIVLFGILNLAFKKFHDIISENGGDYK